MRAKTHIQLFAVAFGAASASPGVASAQDAVIGGGRIVIEGLILWRDDYKGGNFTVNDTGGGGGLGIVSGAGTFNPETTGGLRVLADIPSQVLGGLIAPGYALQLGAMAARGFEGKINFDDPNEDTTATYAADGGGIVSPPLSGANSDQIGRFEMDIETTIAGYESNLLSPVNAMFGGRWFVGSRFMHYSEDIGARLFDNFPPAANNHQVAIDVDNEMFGVQAGWEGYFPVGNGVSIGGRFAGGLYLNHVTRDRNFFDEDTPGNAYSDSRSGNEFSQMLEANPKILIDLGGNTALTLGGTVLWFNDISQASTHWSNMLNLADRNLRANEDVVFYGATAGLTMKFD